MRRFVFIALISGLITAVSFSNGGCLLSAFASANDAYALSFGSETPDDWNPDHPVNPGSYLLTLLVDDAATGSVSGGGMYPQGTEVTVTATPAEGYGFVRWSDGNTNSTRVIKISKDTELTAFFEKRAYAVTFVNYDGAVLQSSDVLYGDMPAYKGETPVRPATDEYIYTFAGWDPQITQVKGEATYTAVYDAEFLGQDTVIVESYVNIADLPVGRKTHIIVMPNGSLYVSKPTVVTSLTLMVESRCGEVDGINRLTASTVDMVYSFTTLTESTSSNWFAFAVPFEVAVSGGIRREGTNSTAVPGRDFVIDEYDGALRASTQEGWKRVAATNRLQPGHFYMLSPRENAQWRFTAVDASALNEASSVQVHAYPSEIGDHHAGWNGIANPMWQDATATLEGVSYATTYNNLYGVYEVQMISGFTFTPAIPFFVQTPAEGSILFYIESYLGGGASDPPAPAPSPSSDPDDDRIAPHRRRIGTNYTTSCTLQLTDPSSGYTDKAYLTISEDKEDRYQIGRDLEKMPVNNAAVPQLWLQAYDMRLAAYDIPGWDYSTLIPVGFYAPADGIYTFTVTTGADENDICLLRDGKPVEATGNSYMLQLEAGVNNGWTIARANAPTSLSIGDTQPCISKFLLNGRLYIRKNNRLYDITGTEIR